MTALPVLLATSTGQPVLPATQPTVSLPVQSLPLLLAQLVKVTHSLWLGLDCASDCETCTSSLASDCSLCLSGFFSHPTTSVCSISCPAGYFEVAASRTCSACHSSCQTCSGGATTDCTSCPSLTPVLGDGSCPVSCASNQFYNSDTSSCDSCNSICSQCTSATNGDCQACVSGATLSGGVCSCDPGKFWNDPICDSKIISLTLDCASNCEVCSSNLISDCSLCSIGFYQYSSAPGCYSFCLSSYYTDSPSRTCIPCSLSC